MKEDLGGLGIRLFVVLDGHGEVNGCCCCCLQSVAVLFSVVEYRCRSMEVVAAMMTVGPVLLPGNRITLTTLCFQSHSSS